MANADTPIALSHRLARKPLIAVSIVGITLLGSIGYVAMSAKWQAQETHDAVKELTAAVTKLADTQSQGVNQENFHEAVTKSIETYIATSQQKQVQDKLDAFSAAPEEPIGDKWIYGNPKARFTLVEYADTECGYCKKFHSTPKGIVDASKGNVNWQFKHLAILGTTSVRKAEAAECVGEQLGNRAFWAFMNDVYHTSGDITSLARGVGANNQEFQSCIAEGRYRQQILDDAEYAKSQGLTGTPATMVVDNQTGRMQLLGGAQPAQAFLQVMRQMMAKPEEAGT